MKFNCEYHNSIYQVNVKGLKDAFLKWAKHYSKTLEETTYAERVDVWISRKGRND